MKTFIKADLTPPLFIQSWEIIDEWQIWIHIEPEDWERLISHDPTVSRKCCAICGEPLRSKTGWFRLKKMGWITIGASFGNPYAHSFVRMCPTHVTEDLRFELKRARKWTCKRCGRKYPGNPPRGKRMFCDKCTPTKVKHVRLSTIDQIRENFEALAMIAPGRAREIEEEMIRTEGIAYKEEVLDGVFENAQLLRRGSNRR